MVGWFVAIAIISVVCVVVGKIWLDIPLLFYIPWSAFWIFVAYFIFLA